MSFLMLVTSGSIQLSGLEVYIEDFNTCQGKTKLKVILGAEGRVVQIKFEWRLVGKNVSTVLSTFKLPCKHACFCNSVLYLSALK